MLLWHLPKKTVLPAIASRQPRLSLSLSLSQPVRFKRYEAYDARLDQDALAEARVWYNSFDASKLPKGNTSYARSSGPGGQHVNKYEMAQGLPLFRCLNGTIRTNCEAG